MVSVIHHQLNETPANHFDCVRNPARGRVGLLHRPTQGMGIDPDKALAAAAEHAVKEIGTNAFPTLLKWVQVKDSRLKFRLNALLDRQSFIHSRLRTADEWHGLALDCFRILGTNALPAGPALVQLFQSPDKIQRYYALCCLINIDFEEKLLLPLMLEAFHNADPNVREEAAFYIGTVYPEEAEKAGVYKMYPNLKPSTTNAPEMDPPPTK
jgi:hypothetical protein